MISLSDAINDYNTWTPAQLVQEYGSSAKAAKAAGVSTRTMERWVTAKGTQKRKPSKPSQEKINQAGREANADKTMGIEFDGTAAINGPASNPDYVREWYHDFTFSPEEWAELSERAAAGDESGLWDMIADKYQVNSIEFIDGTINIGEE